MDLPKNGSVVIIDDKIEEAFPLMNTYQMYALLIHY